MPDAASPGAAHGVLPALLADLVPDHGTALLIGDMPDDLVEVATKRMAGVHRVQVDPGRADPASTRVPPGLADPADLHALIVALGPATTVGSGTDHEQGWQQRVLRLAGLLEPGGCLVLGVANHGPLREWARAGAPTPVGSGSTEPDHPLSSARVAQVLAERGLRPISVHCLFGPAHAPSCALDSRVAAAARPGDLPSSLANAALGGVAGDDLIRAGYLPDLAVEWIVVLGGSGRGLYTALDDGTVIAGEVAPARDAWQLTCPGSATAPQWLPPRLPSGPSVEAGIREALARDDLTRLRRIASDLGAWVRDRHREGGLPWPVPLDDVFEGPDGLALGFTGRSTEPVEEVAVDPDTVLAGAWLHLSMRHPGQNLERAGWEQWLSDEERQVQWLRFCGVADPVRSLAAARARGEGAAAPSPLPPAPLAASEEEPALLGLVTALRTALELREKQLRYRENRLLSLRSQSLRSTRDKEAAEAALEAILASRTFRAAQALQSARHPAQLRQRLLARGRRVAGRAAHVRRQIS